MQDLDEDHPRQDIIEFLCGAGTYDSLWWEDTPKDKRPTYWWRSKLRDYVAELTKENKAREIEDYHLKQANQRLTEQVEKLKAENGAELRNKVIEECIGRILEDIPDGCFEDDVVFSGLWIKSILNSLKTK